MSGRLRNITDKIRTNAGRVSYVFLCLIFFGFCLLGTGIHRDIMYAALPFWVLTAVDAGMVRRLLDSMLVKSLLAFYVYAVISIAWSDPIELEQAWTTVKSPVFGLLFVVVLASLAPDDKIDKLVRVYVLGAVVAGLLALWSAYADNGLLSGRLGLTGRGENPNVAGFLLGWALVAYVALAGRETFASAWWWLAVPVLIVAVLATESRSSILAMFFSLSVIAVFSRRDRRVFAPAVCSAAALLVVFGLAVVLDYGRIGADPVRLEIWSKIMDMIMERPLIGAGMGSAYEVTVSNGGHFTGAHNVLLGTWYQMGIVGLVLFLVPLWLLLRHAVRAALGNGDYFQITILAFGLVAWSLEFHTVVINLNREWLIWLLPIALCLRDQYGHELHRGLPAGSGMKLRGAAAD